MTLGNSLMWGQREGGDPQPESSKPPPKLTLEERKVEALERIAGALETRNVIDESMANFTQLLTTDARDQRTVTGVDGEFADLAPDGLPRKRR
jgi:hypothetical protein